MFGIGLSEILIIGFVAILLIKPDDIPKVFRQVGHIVGQLKSMYNEIMSVKDQIITEIDEAARLDDKPEASGNSSVRNDDSGKNTP